MWAGAASCSGHLHSPPCTILAAESSDGKDNIKLGPVGKARAFLCALPPSYWQALLTVCLLYVARFDVCFVTLHARMVGPAAEGSALPFHYCQLANRSGPHWMVALGMHNQQQLHIAAARVIAGQGRVASSACYQPA